MYGLAKLAYDYLQEKIARSTDARNNRNYRKMVETFPGKGTLEEQIIAQRGGVRSGGFGQFEQNVRALQNNLPTQNTAPAKWPVIAHGTSVDAANAMLRDGYDTSYSKRALLGDGPNFTSGEDAQQYAKSKGRSHIQYTGADGKLYTQKMPISPFTEDRMLQYNDNPNLSRDFIHADNAANRAAESVQKNPNAKFPGMTHDQGASVRIANPTDLRGTGLMLPNRTQFRAFDIERVAPNMVRDMNMSKVDILRANATRKNVGKLGAGWGGGKAMTDNIIQFHGMKHIPANLLRPHGEVPGYNAPLNKSPAMTQSQLSEIGKPPNLQKGLGRFGNFLRFLRRS